MLEPLRAHVRALLGQVAGVVDGEEVREPAVEGFINSEFDAFLNHLFARGTAGVAAATGRLEGRPGFVWLDDAGRVAEPLRLEGMVADLGGHPAEPPVPAEIEAVLSPDDVTAWHEVYSGVFGADPRSRADWSAVHAALGPAGEDRLVLLLARVDGAAAATAAVFFDGDVAGLYCFTTRESMRGRGLASALVHASHAAARARGVRRALLHATPSGRPVYARAGYRPVGTLPVLRVRRERP